MQQSALSLSVKQYLLNLLFKLWKGEETSENKKGKVETCSDPGEVWHLWPHQLTLCGDLSIKMRICMQRYIIYLNNNCVCVRVCVCILSA